MPSVKLNQLLSLGASFLSQGKGIAQNPKAAAVDLLKKNPLERAFVGSKSPTAHLVTNPLEFQHIQFPDDLGQDGGHYMIFYSISNNKSLKMDKKFNESIDVAVDTEDSAVANPNLRSKRLQRLKKTRGGQEIKIGRPAANSVLTGGLQTHSQVTGGVALYMPPSIKTSYSANTGHSDLELAGMVARTASRALGAGSTQEQVKEFLAGVGGVTLDAARKLATGLGEAAGLGDIRGAITKVTATAPNNFSEAVFQSISPREFSYTFNLIARSKSEAQKIQKIIKFFKFHMHPELDGDSQARYFRVPSEFEIHYAYNGQKNNYLHELSRCVLQNVTVDYGGDNFQSFRQFDEQGAAPVNISLSLNFIETTVLTKQEIVDGF